MIPRFYQRTLMVRFFALLQLPLILVFSIEARAGDDCPPLQFRLLSDRTDGAYGFTDSRAIVLYRGDEKIGSLSFNVHSFNDGRVEVEFDRVGVAPRLREQGYSHLLYGELAKDPDLNRTGRITTVWDETNREKYHEAWAKLGSQKGPMARFEAACETPSAHAFAKQGYKPSRVSPRSDGKIDVVFDRVGPSSRLRASKPTGPVVCEPRRGRPFANAGVGYRIGDSRAASAALTIPFLQIAFGKVAGLNEPTPPRDPTDTRIPIQRFLDRMDQEARAESEALDRGDIGPSLKRGPAHFFGALLGKKTKDCASAMEKQFERNRAKSLGEFIGDSENGGWASVPP